jgi:MoaA/NifB/PqqE/SkfB family radical SAM enzyme
VTPATQPDAAPTKRVDRELTTDEWRAILDKAWGAGIPHVTFTGGEPTLREDLPNLIAHAESLGMVCGLMTDGIKLEENDYLHTLLQTGLDHVLITLDPKEASTWDAIRLIVPADLFLTVHITINQKTARDGEKLIEKLSELGVQNISLSAPDKTFLGDMLIAQKRANELGLTLRWDLPVPYSASSPAAYETEDDNVPAGAGRAWLYVEPDGDVLPTQGEADKVMGNMLNDPWEKIYQK